MARSTREELELTSAFLKEIGHAERAHPVDAILAHGGWKLLQKSAEGSSPLSITTTEDIRGALRAAAEQVGWDLGSVATDGYKAVLDGSWLPPERGAKPRSTAASPAPVKRSPRVTLAVEIPNSLRERVQELLPELSKKAGYRITEGGIALSWMLDELGVEDPGGQGVFKTMVRQRLRDHLVREADRQSVSLQEVLEAGIRDVVAGRVPEFKRAAKNTRTAADGAPVRLSIPVDADLLARLNEIAPELSARLDRQIYPGTLALTILKNKLGEPDTE